MASPIQFLVHPWELISTLWESPPNIPAPVSLTAGSVPLTPPEQALVPHGLCGWMPAEPGGAGSFVCQAMGQVMPGVVFFVSMTVLTLTILFLIRYVRRSSAVADELEALIKSLEPLSASPGEWAKKEAWDKIRGKLVSSGEKNPPLAEFAKRVQTSILALPGATQDRVVLKNPVAVLVDEVRSHDRWSGQAMAEALPGWLTAIGLLTTFLAILLGLQGVKVLTNLEVRGIGGLVNGLSGKFFSSIIALGCAISITITQYFVTGATNIRWNRLTDLLQELLPHLSVERVFLEMIQSKKSER